MLSLQANASYASSKGEIYSTVKCGQASVTEVKAAAMAFFAWVRGTTEWQGLRGALGCMARACRKFCDSRHSVGRIVLVAPTFKVRGHKNEVVKLGGILLEFFSKFQVKLVSKSVMMVSLLYKYVFSVEVWCKRLNWSLEWLVMLRAHKITISANTNFYQEFLKSRKLFVLMTVAKT